MIRFIIRAVDVILYIVKLIAYSLIGMYLWGQMKAGEIPYTEKVQNFLDWTNGAMLPFLMWAAISEALHIVIKPFLKMVDIYEKRRHLK